MSTLSTSILELGFTTERNMEEALARQVMYGGDLGSNLLELSLLTEEQLLEATALSTGLDRAPLGELPPTPEPLIRIVPENTQRRYGVHVLGEHDGHLEVAVCEKLSPPVEAELAAAAGRPLRQLVAPWARIEQALAQGSGRPLPPRAASLLRRLDGHGSMTPVGQGLPIDFKQLPRPESVPPLAFTMGTDVDTAPPPEGYVELAQAQAHASAADIEPEHYVRAELTPAMVSTHRRGPYTAAMAERDLLEAKDRHEVLTSFFDFAAQYFEYAALFVFKNGEAVGYRARGAGASSEQLRSVRMPLDLRSAFARIRTEGTWLLTRLRAGGIEGGFARDLARGAGKKVLLLPLVVRNRPVLFLYGDHGSTDVDLTSVGDVLSFAPLASAALERAILHKKGYGRLPGLAALRRRPGFPLPTRDQKAQAFVQAVGAPETNPSTEQGHQNPSLPAPPAASHAPFARALHPWNLRPSSAPPFPSDPPRTLPGAVGAMSPGVGALSDDASVIPMRPTVSLEPGPPDRPPSEPPAHAPPPPSFDPESEPPEEGWDIDSTFEEQEQRTAAGVGPHASHNPTFAFGSPETPLGWFALIDRWCEGDEAALGELLEAGDAAVAALVSRFPGPLPQVSGRDMPGKASECGPILGALVRLGERAIPYLTVRTADEDAHVREWATRLLGELPSRESAQAVARRTVDDAVGVRRAALAAARMSRHIPEARVGTQRQLEELASDRALPSQVRRAAVEALTDLRETEALPCLIQLLGEEDREVSGAARWALVVLTRQDFGADQDLWSRYFNGQKSRHRIEWLIDALTHENRDLRRAAGDELKNISGEYFGYYDDLPATERARVQELYREWWVREGRKRFQAH